MILVHLQSCVTITTIILEYFCHPKKFRAICSHSPSHLTPVSVDLPVTDTSCTQHHALCGLGVWPLDLLVFSGPILLQPVLVLCSFLWPDNIPLSGCVHRSGLQSCVVTLCLTF